MASQQELRPYQTLFVRPGADEEAIEQAYRHRVSELKSKGLTAVLPEVHLAYAIVGNPDSRRLYDAWILDRTQEIQLRGGEMRRTLVWLRKVAAELAEDLAFRRRQLEVALRDSNQKERYLDRMLLRNWRRSAWAGLKALCVARHDLARAEVLVQEARQALIAREGDILLLLREMDLNDDRFAEVMRERNLLHRPAELSWFGSI